MHSSAQRLFAVLILAFWMTPSAGVFAVGLHVLLEDHGHSEAGHAEAGHTQAGHAQELAELAQAMAHGHYHDAGAVPDHRHDVIFDGVSPAVKSAPALAAVLPSAVPLEGSSADRSAPCRPSNHGPPLPLFTAHCSLLL